MPTGNRLYSNGSVTQVWLHPDEVQGWLDYNREFRPGCELFIDGVQQKSGGLCSKTAIEEYKLQIEEDRKAMEETEKLLANAVCVFGLRNQGHLPTIERMLADGCGWDEIGKEIGWMPDAARDEYERLWKPKT